MSKFQTFYEIVNFDFVVLTNFLKEIWPFFMIWPFRNCLWPNLAFLIFLTWQPWEGCWEITHIDTRGEAGLGGVQKGSKI
jgi:hypothetical protein